MGKVYTPTPVTTVQSPAEIEQNFSDIESALDDALVRTEVATNTMGAPLDLNQFSVLNGKLIQADLVEAGTVPEFDGVAVAANTGGVLAVERKKGYFNSLVDTTPPHIFGFSGAVAVYGDSSLVNGNAIVVPAGAGGLSLSITDV